MMKEVFLDTNIVIDYLTDRKPFSQSVFRLFALAEKGKIRLNISAISFTIVYYVLRKNNSHRAIIQNLMLLSNLCNVLPVNQMIIDKAIKSGISDFEDAVQYYSALQNKNCSVIISRNTKDFQSSVIKVMLPDEFLKTNKLI